MDPGTGLAPTFEVARGLAALARSGWTPERSIMFAFWDAEEFGLIGSTEYAEAMQNELREKAIVYINTDLSMRGRFDGGGTPSLRDFLVQVTRDVPHFDGAGSVYDRWRADEWLRQPVERRRRGPDGFEVELAALGSGADFVAFQDFLGLPTLQMEFDFEGSYGPYHSNYDTRQFVEQHTDPGFRGEPDAGARARIDGHAARVGGTSAFPLLALRAKDRGVHRRRGRVGSGRHGPSAGRGRSGRGPAARCASAWPQPPRSKPRLDRRRAAGAVTAVRRGVSTTRSCGSSSSCSTSRSRQRRAGIAT